MNFLPVFYTARISRARNFVSASRKGDYRECRPFLSSSRSVIVSISRADPINHFLGDVGLS